MTGTFGMRTADVMLSRTLLHASSEALPGAADDGDPARPEAQAGGARRSLRVLIAGGGTGGHLFPGVALAEEVRARGGEVLFVGTERGIEARVLRERGLAAANASTRQVLKGAGSAG
jgi:hypothetical protein